MFNSVSLTGSGVIVFALLAVLNWLGVTDVQESDAAAVIDAFGKIISFGMIVIGQIRRPDLVAGIVRK